MKARIPELRHITTSNHPGFYGIDGFEDVFRWARSNSLHFRAAECRAQQLGLNAADSLKFMLVALIHRVDELEGTLANRDQTDLPSRLYQERWG